MAEKTIDTFFEDADKHEKTHFLRKNGLFVIEERITYPDKSLYCKVTEQKDGVQVYIKEEHSTRFKTNSLPAKAKACAYCENIKQEFLKK